MKAAFATLQARLNARTLRERAILLGAVIAVLILLADTLFIEPARRAHRQHSDNLSSAQVRLATLQAEEAGLQARLAVDPDADTRARLDVLRRESAQADARLAAAVARFIPAVEMGRVLRALLPQGGGLRLEGLHSLPATRLDATVSGTGQATADEAEVAAIQVWKRGIELRLQGDYNALLSYLRAVEQQPWLLNWDLLSVQGGQAQGATFILRLHTLSLDEEWIGV
jgi:MSHA biogenesis protein MshJ